MRAGPRKTALIRTRLDVARVLERVSGLIDDPTAKGAGRWLAGGYFTGGTVGSRDFQLEYFYNSAENSQTFDVAGTVQDDTAWRVVHLTIEPQQSAMGVVLVAAVVVFFTGGSVWAGAMTALQAIGVTAGILGLLAVVQLLFLPKVVSSRVSRRIAETVDGSIFQRGEWKVPRGMQWW